MERRDVLRAGLVAAPGLDEPSRLAAALDAAPFEVLRQVVHADVAVPVEVADGLDAVTFGAPFGVDEPRACG